MVRVAAYLLGTALVLAISVLARADEGEIAVITHPSQPVSLTTSDVRRLYLKQRRFWPDGAPVIPINQTAETPTRALFERTVFSGEASRLPSYWNQRYFEGLLPPITLGSDEAVRRYVAARPNAVGYVDARALDDSVHVALRLRDARRSRP